MKRFLTLLAALICLSGTLFSQDKSSSGFGLDPSDEAALKQIRARMARIRKTRPTIALVLSGGGAKGAAHVGALKYMEKYKIPIDMVVGTSIGGLIGGLYSMGYSPDYLDSLIRSIDWDVALTDDVPREFIPYSRLRYREKFALSFPFYYSHKDFSDRLSQDLGYTGERGRLNLSAGNDDPAKMVSDNLRGSLPSGFVFGQNVDYIFSSLTVGHADSTDFFQFPIPFACVATDIISGKAKVWHSGNINTALRSTMSIPGLFAPVRTGGMVLVDGGMRNNFPVDLAREMGADIVIGIDLSDARKDVTEIRNLLDIVWRGIDMFADDSFERNIKEVDLRIKPDLHEYSMMSFNEEAIDTMIVRGFNAAKAMDSELAAIRRWAGSDKFRRRGRPAVDINNRPVSIDSIEIAGVSRRDADYIRSKLYINPRKLINRREAERAVASIYGTGSYDYVNYRMLGTREPYRMRIDCIRGPIHQLGVGIRLDSDDLVSLLLNVGLNTRAMRGHSLDLTAKIGVNPYVDVHYAFDIPKLPTFNVSAKVRWTDRGNFLWGPNVYNIAYLMTTQEAYVSKMHWSHMDIRGGLKNDYFVISRILGNSELGDYDSALMSRDYPGFFVDGSIRTLDNAYFPKDGFAAHLRYDLLSRVADGADYPRFFGILSASGMLSVPITKRLSLIPQGWLRFLFGRDIALPYANVMGGDMAGRYVEQQIPFMGIGPAAYRRNYLVCLRADLRYEIFSNNFISAIANFSRDFENFPEFEFGENILGFGIGYAYNSIVGPLKAQLSWSTLTRSVDFYVGLGFDF